MMQFLANYKWWFIGSFLAALLLFLMYLLIRALYRFSHRIKPHPVDEMDGIEFEHFLADKLEEQGFDVEVTQPGHDYGADLIIERDGIKTAVQAKRYEANISISAVQEAFTAAAFYDCDNALVITNSYYTSSARTLADKIGVELWDRDTLTELGILD